MAYMHEELVMDTEEFLRWSTDQAGLHELIAGQPYRAQERDSKFFRVLVNLSSVLKQHLRGSEDTSFIRGQSVVVDEYNVVVPDLMVVPRSDSGRQPRIVFDIVAGRTLAAEIRRRSAAAHLMRSLLEHVTLDVENREAILRRRDATGVWTTTSFREEEVVEFTTLGMSIRVADAFLGLDRNDPALTLREFLTWNADETIRHEFHKGAIITMAGTTVNHNRVVQGINFHLLAQMRSTQCDVFIIDVQLNVEGVPGSYLPDLCVACDPQDLTNDDAIERPLLLIEVLSRSTRAYDRTVKRRSYLQIPTLMEYVLVDYLARRIDIHRREPDGRWSLHQLIGDAPLELKSVDLVIPAEEVYRRVRFADSVRLPTPSQTAATPTPAWRARLEEISHMPVDWDDAGASPVDERALKGATALLQLRPEVARECTIFPTREGGIEIEFIRGDWDLSASFSSDGQIEIFGVEQRGSGELQPQTFGEVGADLLRLLDQFLVSKA